MANIENKRRNEERAASLYWKSVHASIDNDNQQALSFVKLGDYYFNVKTVFIDNEDIHYIVTISDITLRKLQEEELIYKSVASKEMHHRVKNNLQTIAALLRLQRNNA